ncbi:hypothetical protein QYS36_14970 [Pseudomonas sp. G34]|uniref:hypothetical protein n=1 Tax=Pseudomonas sp. G34 TaxID=3059083 RepID=UPI002808CEA9|nr:hypothetical protein [Pseudomonas sp. G34]MDQ7986240.1 hypothetical protein [Pseudomonas sp. G34]
MNDFFIYGVAVFSAAALGGAYLLVKKRGVNTVQIQSSPVSVETAGITSADIMPAEMGTELIVAGVDGRPLVKTRLITQVPAGAPTFSGQNDVAVKRGQQLAADLLKGVVTLPNKTLELVFDPEIHKGLVDGTLTIMEAAGGGQRAIAVAGNGKIAGHGRLLEAGKAKQLAAGAFHLLSIAVAQSHLADINRSLTEIQGAIERLQRAIDDKDHAQLRGSMNYLEYLVGFMRDLETPDLFPQEKRNQLEAIKHQTMQWIEQLQLEALRLKGDIEQQQEVDTFGTGETHKALMVHAAKVNGLLQKRDVLLRILALLDIGTAYLDPIARGKWTLSLGEKCGQSFKEIDALLTTQRDRSIQLLSKATFNRKGTLDQRRNELLSENEGMRVLTLEHQKTYVATADILTQHLKKYRNENQPIRTALTFDQHGEVCKVAML